LEEFEVANGNACYLLPLIIPEKSVGLIVSSYVRIATSCAKGIRPIPETD
jgi:hypothetical protein